MHEPMDTAPAATPAEPAHASLDGGEVIFEERLSPSVGVWLVALMLAGLCILVFAPIDPWVGVAAAVVFFGIEAALLITGTPRIVVTDRTLSVGRASIERRHLGEVTGYRGEDARQQRGPSLHGLAYVTVRGWISPVVRVQITDERDRTPYWLTSTRRPEELVGALGGRMAGSGD